MALQIDWLRMEDHQAALRKALVKSTERLGVTELAHWLAEEPSTLRNQLAHRDRKRPSADLEHLCWLLDPEYRQEKASILGELLMRPPDLSPEEAMRTLAVEAQAQGYVPKERVAELLARMRFDERSGLKAVGT